MVPWLPLALALAQGPATAENLRWTALPGCPGPSQLQAAVEGYLGVAIADSSGADRRIAAQVEHTDAGWVAHIEVLTDAADNPMRTLPPAPTCAEAADAAALVIAISIDPAAVERTEAAKQSVPAPEPEPEPVPAPEPVPDPEPPSPPVTTPPTPPTPPADRRRPPLGLRGAVGLHGGIEFGALPGVTGLIGASASLLGPRVRVFVDANVLPLHRLLLGAATIDFRQWAVGLGGCPVFAVAERWALAPCVAVEAGEVLADVRDGLSGAPPRPAAVWAAARASGRVEWNPVARLGVHAGVDLVVPFARPQFSAQGVDGAIHESRPAGVRGTLGVEVRFP